VIEAGDRSRLHAQASTARLTFHTRAVRIGGWSKCGSEAGTLSRNSVNSRGWSRCPLHPDARQV